MYILFENVELSLETRNQRRVRNELLKRLPTPGDELMARDFRAKYPGCNHRPTRVSLQYNCHGLTFAARRTAITDGESIQAILDDDGYVSVVEDGVEAGDIVVYSEDGDYSHSGIVTKIDPVGNAKVIWVLSKWGKAHEVIHRVHDCPYAGHPGTEIRFWRIVQ
jgi:hypothetical protein